MAPFLRRIPRFHRDENSRLAKVGPSAMWQPRAIMQHTVPSDRHHDKNHSPPAARRLHVRRLCYGKASAGVAVFESANLGVQRCFRHVYLFA